MGEVMRTQTRLQRLESARDASQADTLTFWESMELFGRIDRWLADNGFEDELAAVESGEPIPSEMLAVIEDYARWCPRHRAFRRIEAGTATDADVEVFLKIPE